jgi:hypothetical protein
MIRFWKAVEGRGHPLLEIPRDKSQNVVGKWFMALSRCVHKNMLCTLDSY